ncbi:hypothetical protein ACVXHB_28140 [Escherichia coli]
MISIPKEKAVKIEKYVLLRVLMTELYRHLGADTDVPAGDRGWWS